MVKPLQYMSVYMYMCMLYTLQLCSNHREARLVHVSRSTLSVLKHYHVVQGNFPNISYSQINATLKSLCYDILYQINIVCLKSLLWNELRLSYSHVSIAMCGYKNRKCKVTVEVIYTTVVIYRKTT